MKNQFKIENLPYPINSKETASNACVDDKFSDPFLEKVKAIVDFNHRSLDNVRFVKVNSLLAFREQLKSKMNVDSDISSNVDESSLLRLDPDKKLKLDERDFIFLNSILTSAKIILEIPDKAYVDSSIQNNRNRKDMSTVFND